jgi:glycine/D-amino acid oxidase-like deaminating enzyme
MPDAADVVVCGAGMAGLATAYHLAVRRGVRRVTIVDEREPLTLTSDKGTQAYRNWWPGPDDTMLRYMTRSIDLLEEMADESGNTFRLNRRGYVFVTAQEAGVEQLRENARRVSAYGMGEVREHTGLAHYHAAPAEGFHDQPIGADLLLGADARRAFAGLTTDVAAALHVRRAGWLNGVALGTWLLKRALGAGVTFARDRLIGFEVRGGRVSGVRLASGASIATERVVIAAGPALADVARLLELELPIFHELHAKVTLRDRHGVVARAAPFLIWNDPIDLPWTDAERNRHARDESGRRLLDSFPGGVHVRPVDGPHGDEIYLIWTYDVEARAFVWPPRFDPHYAEVAIRGAASMLPAMREYFGAGGSAFVDGGYYCKTHENRPLVGPLAVEGAYVIGALSGYGIMGSHAAGELVAAHVTGAPLPGYAGWLLPSRYDRPEYRETIASWGANLGQL